VSGPRPRRVAVCPAIKRKNCCSGDSREHQELETKPPLLLWNNKQETGEQPGQEQDAGLGGTIAQLDRTGDEFGPDLNRDEQETEEGGGGSARDRREDSPVGQLRRLPVARSLLSSTVGRSIPFGSGVIAERSGRVPLVPLT
jgi:hypothetical protein